MTPRGWIQNRKRKRQARFERVYASALEVQANQTGLAPGMGQVVGGGVGRVMLVSCPTTPAQPR